MLSAALLLAYGVTVGTWGAGSLARARWTSRAPRLAIAAWQGVAVSVLLSLVGAGATMSVNVEGVRGGLAGVLHLCTQNLDAAYASPGGAVAATAGLTAAGLLLTRTAWCAVAVGLQERRERRSRRAVLDLVARADVLPGVLVLEHDAPYAFCIGGRRRRVVVTDSLLQTLDGAELEAVLAHEAAHLRQRHHLALAICRTLFGALSPFFPAFRSAMPHVRFFAELSADDGARRRVGAPPLHSALGRLAGLAAPPATLSASGGDVEVRLLRLTDRKVGLPKTLVALTTLSIAAVVLVPLALAAAPGAAMAWQSVCLIG